jgi:hypothetical protein
VSFLFRLPGSDLWTHGEPVVVNFAEYSGLLKSHEPISFRKGTLNSHDVRKSQSALQAVHREIRRIRSSKNQVASAFIRGICPCLSTSHLTFASIEGLSDFSQQSEGTGTVPLERYLARGGKDPIPSAFSKPRRQILV